MNVNSAISQPARIRPWHVVGLLLLCLPLLGAVAVTGYLRLGAQTRSLRGALMNATGGEWNKRFALHVGWGTLTLVRCGSRFFHLPPEPRAALETLRGAEVGIYESRDDRLLWKGNVFEVVDKAMAHQGMLRVVGVQHDGDLVAVYMPRGRITVRNLSCAVMVLHDRQLIVASGSGDPTPLLELAMSRAEGKFGWMGQGRWGRSPAAIEDGRALSGR
jgi:hypothetical protein